MRILLVVVALLFTTAAWTQTPQCPLTGATAGAAGTYRAGLKIPATTFKR